MRIGELAKKYNMTIDTLRYYMELGLLIPPKKGAQYSFSAREEHILEFIQKLKLMHFSLKEIEQIIAIYRTSNWVEPHTMSIYETFLRTKAGELKAQEVSLQYAVSKIEQELQLLPSSSSNTFTVGGVPIRAVPFLHCPHCHLPLKIENGTLQDQYITSGSLKCPCCDYSAKIENGILLTGNLYSGDYDSPDLDRNLYQSFNDKLIRAYQQASDVLLTSLQEKIKPGNIVFEDFINGYFFLYTHLNDLPKDVLYIVADKYPDTLNMYRQLISAVAPDAEILYLADASMQYPLKQHCIDILVDFFSVNEHDLYFKEPYHMQLMPYLNHSSIIIGTNMHLQPNARSRKHYASKYPECNADVCTFKSIEQPLSQSGYQITSRLLCSLNETPNQYSFACHINGEELRLVYYEATISHSAD